MSRSRRFIRSSRCRIGPARPCSSRRPALAGLKRRVYRPRRAGQATRSPTKKPRVSQAQSLPATARERSRSHHQFLQRRRSAMSGLVGMMGLDESTRGGRPRPHPNRSLLGVLGRDVVGVFSRRLLAVASTSDLLAHLPRRLRHGVVDTRHQADERESPIERRGPEPA